MDLPALNADHYRLILDSLAEGVCTVDRNWTITSFNRSAQALTDVSAAQALGLSFGDLFQCEACECHALLSRVMASGESLRDVATRIMDRQGNRIPITLNATPFRNAAGGIEGLVASFRDNRPIEALRQELRHTFTVGDMVSKNPRMRRIFETLAAVAESDSTVLILGPSGTGKELLARAVHQGSARHGRPFVAVNCGALPDNLLESELFGYKKGAFTDARADKPGRFALADGGTLFLDEIGDTSPAMQVKLLRVLQERAYEPLGATAPVAADVRVIAATNRDLAARVAEGSFRADLYYRINVISFELPPLAERPEDIPLLVAHFIEALNAEQGRSVRGFSSSALERLMHYSFPGNIRELRNIVERAYVLCRCEEIPERCLPPELLEPRAPSGSAPAAEGHYVNLRRLPPDAERAAIEAALRASNGSRKEAAARLDIDPATLWRKMKRHGLL